MAEMIPHVEQNIMAATGPVYNGEMWRKIDLMIYIETAIDLKAQVMAYLETSGERQKRQRFLVQNMTRKKLTFPSMSKPSGLAALSGARRREYERWLAAAPEREAEQRRFEEREDARIAGLNEEWKAIQMISVRERESARVIAERYTAHMLKQVIPPDYREDEAMRLLLGYLSNNRAHTLTDAINLYHQEQHWRAMEEIADQQRRDIQAAQQQQQRLLREQIALQREQMVREAEHMRAVESDAAAARRAAESADFWLMMNYLKE